MEGGIPAGRRALDDSVREELDRKISLAPLFRTLWNYRYVVVVGTGAFFGVFTLWSLYLYITQPTERQASVDVGFTFMGAASNRYPNGTEFSAADVIETPILTAVFERNQLERYISFETFQSGIFVLNAGHAEDLVRLEYGAQLADGGLSAVQRDQIEAEYESRLQSVRGPNYSLNLNLISSSGEPAIPEELLYKVLDDVLNTWRTQSIPRMEQMSIASAGQVVSFAASQAASDSEHIARVDAVRVAGNQMLTTLVEMEASVPDGTLVQIGNAKSSVRSIRAELQTILTTRVEPLAAYIWSNDISREPGFNRRFVESHLFELELDRTVASGTAEFLEESLSIYRGSRDASTYAGAQRIDLPAGTEDATLQSGESLAYNGAFLQGLMGMVEDRARADVTYRQEMVARILVAQEELLRVEREAAYYTRMNDVLEGSARPGNARRDSGPGASSSVDARVSELEAVIAGIGDQLGGALTEFGDYNLNSAGSVFRVSGPFSVRVLRGYSLRSIGFNAVFVLVAGLFFMPLSCLVFHYARREIFSSSGSPDVFPTTEAVNAPVERRNGP